MDNETLDTESCFVGMILANHQLLVEMENYPKREWFKNEQLGRLSDTIQKSGTVDALELSNLCRIPHGTILELAVNAPLTHNPKAYADQIFYLYKGRRIQEVSKKWDGTNIYDQEFFASVDKDMADLQEISGGTNDVIYAGQSCDNWMGDKESRISGDTKAVPSGFPTLDRLFAGGLHRKDLITVAGRPGSGKSAFLKSGFINMLKDNPGVKVAIFSIEMTPNEYLDRMCSEWARIQGTKLREAVNLSEEELDRLMDFGRNFHDSNFCFNRVQACTVFDILRLAKSAKLKMGGLDCVFVDHLHIIKNHDKRLQEQEKIAEQTINLKRLAQELDTPVVLAAQCNREQEKRPDKTPQMSDLRGSGTIEQDSNCIIFIHRPGLYDTEVDPGLAEVALRKNRHGPSPAKLTFKFEPDFTAFVEMA